MTPERVANGPVVGHLIRQHRRAKVWTPDDLAAAMTAEHVPTTGTWVLWTEAGTFPDPDLDRVMAAVVAVLPIRPLEGRGRPGYRRYSVDLCQSAGVLAGYIDACLG